MFSMGLSSTVNELDLYNKEKQPGINTKRVEET